MDLSVIIPAYNEKTRLPPTIWKVFSHLEKNFHGSYEVVVMDDGSTDGTDRVVVEMLSSYPALRLIRLPENHGRGMMVREGMKSATGELILEMDADASVDVEAIGRFAEYMGGHAEVGMAIGSRNIKGARIVTRQPLKRRLLGYVFVLMSMALFGWDWRDRVNGFKMFRRKAADNIFSCQVENGFLAEAEIVYIAQRRGVPYELLPVSWTDSPDSRIRPLRDSWRSFWGMFTVVLRDIKGAYRQKT